MGGGQLGRMFCVAAQRLGFRVLVLDPEPGCPAGAVADEQILADYDDSAALGELARRCVAVTTEFENVPASALDMLGRHIAVSPSAASVRIAQDRLQEKTYIQGCGVPVAPHAPVSSLECIDDSLQHLLPGILKTARLGYDGKGQVRVQTLEAVRNAFLALGHVDCVLEKRLVLLKELSVVVARDHRGQCMTFPVAENHHRKGILATTVVPARIDSSMADMARAHAVSIACALDYLGVLCVEFFVVEGMGLVVNEIAPRPHNSGHYSIDACTSCQFEQQVRVLAGLPLGSAVQHSAAVMVNLLGELWFAPDGTQREPDWCQVLALPEAKLYLYGKTQARPGRKMGHVTVLAPDLAHALTVAQCVRDKLGIADDDD